MGGVFAIAAVVDRFSDAVVKNPIVGQESNNPQLREWHSSTPLGLEVAHRDLRISPAEFDEVAAELERTLDFKVPLAEKDEVLAAFAAHKNEVIAGYVPAP